MIKYSDVTTNQELQEAVTAYEQAFGGRFVGDEPGPGLVYLDANGTSYGPRTATPKRTCSRLWRVAKTSSPLSGPIWMGWILTQTSFTDPMIKASC